MVLHSAQERSAVYREITDEGKTHRSSLVLAPLVRAVDNNCRELLASLDAGLGLQYEQRVIEDLVRTALRLASKSVRRFVHSTSFTSSGAAFVRWTGHPRATSTIVRAMREHNSVIAVEPGVSPEITTMPFAAERILRPGLVAEGANPNLWQAAAGSLAAHGYTGAGETLCVADTGLWIGHCRYTSMPVGSVSQRTFSLSHGSGSSSSCSLLSGSSGTKVTYVAYSCPSGGSCNGHVTDFHAKSMDHGTHVASLALNSAPNAKLVAVDLQHATFHGSNSIVPPPNLYTQLFKMAYDCTHARIFSFSWAASYAGVYTTMDRTVDHFTWDYSDSIVLAAGGNEGLLGSNSIGSPSSAKNAIAVGAVIASRAFFQAAHGNNINYSHYWKGSSSVRLEDPSLTGYTGGVFDLQRETDNLPRDTMDWSSRGPCADGRRKPDVAAVGSYVVGDHATGQSSGIAGSCSLDQTNNSMQGTSMATPVLAGAVAVFAQLLDSCSTQHGCVINTTTIANMGSGGWAAPYKAGRIASSAIKAFLAAGAQQVDAEASYVSYWSNGKYVRRPYRSSDPVSLANARAGSGIGEVTVGRLLIPNIHTPLRHTYVYGESGLRSFVSLTPSQALTISGNQATMASVMWSGDNVQNAHCYRTLLPNTRVIATLSWRDYPSAPGCNPCLQSDLALSVVTATAVHGGAALDTTNNLERISITLPVEGTLFKVMVYAISISSAISTQRYSVAITGDVSRLTSMEDCASCAFQSERVPCVDQHGYGDSPCTNNVSVSSTCDQYAACYAKTPQGTTIIGLSSTDCLYGQDTCLGIMFPSLDRTACQTYTCGQSSRQILTHGSGQHVCEYQHTHRCVNYTNPSTGLTEYVISNQCVRTYVNVEHPKTETNSEVFWTILFGFASVSVVLVLVHSCMQSLGRTA